MDSPGLMHPDSVFVSSDRYSFITNKLKKARSDGLASGWNSLHQAAFLNASVKEVEAILRAGALRKFAI